MRPFSIYVSREVRAMLQAKAKLDHVDSIDEVADGLLYDQLKAVPEVQQIIDLKAKSDREFEQKVQELVRGRYDDLPST